MSDLRGYLGEIAGSAETPGPDVVAADLSRGRRALRRRQVRQRVAGSALAAVAVAAVISVGVAYTGGGEAAPPVAASAAALTPVQLVAFEGEQPEGFRVSWVPKGWSVQGSQPGALVLAPDGATDTNPDSFIGKIAVFLQEFQPDGLDVLAEVPVGDRTGQLVRMEGEDGARTLFVPQGEEVFLTIQVWDGLGWDSEMIARFASGITVTDDAEMSHG